MVVITAATNNATVSVSQEWVDRDGNLHIVTVGDGRTVRAGYLWQSTTRREDGLHEHVYKKHDGKR